MDPTAAVAAIAPLLAARRREVGRDVAANAAPPPAAPPKVPATALQGTAPGPPREPLALDVAKGDDGVFVYTLRDPDSGAVLAVIPWSKAKSEAQGALLDTTA